ncbi:MAG TPA: sugar transferase [Terriglobales bacterium]|nr:sugar transferase [Terriglobales bacterium]
MSSHPYPRSTSAPPTPAIQGNLYGTTAKIIPRVAPQPTVISAGRETHPQLARSRSPLAASLAGGRWVQLAYVLVDFSFVLLAFAAAVHIRFGGVIRDSRALLPDHYSGILLMYGSLVVLLCQSQGLYRTPRDRSNWEESTAVVTAVTVATVLLSAVIYVSGIPHVSRLALALSALLITAALTTWRVWKRGIVTRRVAAGVGVKNVLIVGAGKVGQEIADYLHRNKQLGLVVKGFLDHNHHGDPRVLGRIEDLPRVARAQFADEVIITIPFMRHLVRQAIAEARLNNLDVKIIPDLYGNSGRGAVLEQMGGLPVMSLYREPIPMLGRVIKRAMDMVGSALAMILLAPVTAAISLAIKLDSPGPILYRAPRVGKKGRRFVCCKFRTMVANADALKDSLRQLNERQGPTFKITDDPRITRLGRFLRKYSLDELPQLWNVFKGEMSLVGPRPHPVDDYSRYDLEHLRRLDVTPGITGLWQVTARRDPSFQRNVALDLEYIENWSLGLDLNILLRTMSVVVVGRGR